MEQLPAKSVINIAKSSVLEYFSDEELTNVGLEEIEYSENEGVWKVTIGFSRPWNYTKSPILQIQGTSPTREYKLVRINKNGETISIINREAQVG